MSVALNETGCYGLFHLTKFRFNADLPGFCYKTVLN